MDYTASWDAPAVDSEPVQNDAVAHDGYSGSKRPDEDGLVRAFEGLVVARAQRLMDARRLERFADDLIGFGRLGLLQAIRTYDPERGASFRTWAGHCIRGRLLDGCRRFGMVERPSRSRDPERRARRVSVTPAESSVLKAVPAPPEQAPDRLAEDRDTAEMVRRALAALESPYREVLTLYYYESLTLTAIAERYGRSVSWASRVRTDGHKLLEGRLPNLAFER